jgi:hypothetical protein
MCRRELPSRQNVSSLYGNAGHSGSTQQIFYDRTIYFKIWPRHSVKPTFCSFWKEGREM